MVSWLEDKLSQFFWNLSDRDGMPRSLCRLFFIISEILDSN